MEEQYKGHVIRVTTKKDNSAFPWKPFLKYRVNFLIASPSSLARGSIGKSPLEFPGRGIPALTHPSFALSLGRVMLLLIVTDKTWQTV
ncbi:MAG TPA: hypothetical protein VLJ79_12840 [Candidatus Binatia bacterium]|nr:hypothetical protein [Candidatus Binatia bacterium]